jgi:Flp pilus assembly protein TadD
MKAGVQARRKSVDLALEAVGQPTDANLLGYADAAIQARRYSAAAIALQPAFEKDDRRQDVANRLAYAHMREGNYQEAYRVLQRHARAAKLNGYGQTLTALLAAQLNDTAKSDEAIKEALLEDPSATYVRTAQAYLALTFSRRQESRGVVLSLNYDRATNTPERQAARAAFDRLARDLASSAGQSNEIGFYVGALYNRLEEFRRGQEALEQAALAEPMNYDVYIEQGNRALLVANTAKLESKDIDFQYETARAFFNTALAARDDSAEALTGLAIVSVFQGKGQEAVRWATAATAAGPKYAAAQAAQAVAYSTAAKAFRREADQARTDARQPSRLQGEKAELEEKARTAERQANEFEALSRTSLNTAGSLDARILGQELTDVKAVWRYYAVGGRRPVIPAPK